MINLLPPEVKETITYARRNTRLRNWCVALFVSVLAIGAVIVAGQMYMRQTTRSYATQVKQGQAELQAQKLDETQTRVKEVSNSLKLVVQVLSRQIMFSELIKQVGASLPSGSVLSDLSISEVGGGIDLEVATVTYETATQVQLNLQDTDNKIFEKADIVNVQCTSDAANPYPCTVQVRALFAKDNPFQFIKAPVAETKKKS